jgi:hypothetical protein
MKEQFKTVGFWVSFTTSIIGIATLVFGLTQEQSNNIASVIGGVITLFSQLGYIKAEAQVRSVKIEACTHFLVNHPPAMIKAADNRIAIIEAM